MEREIRMVCREEVDKRFVNGRRDKERASGDIYDKCEERRVIQESLNGYRLRKCDKREMRRTSMKRD